MNITRYGILGILGLIGAILIGYSFIGLFGGLIKFIIGAACFAGIYLLWKYWNKHEKV